MKTMGGPYVPLEMALKIIERLLKAKNPFFGKIELECENGQVYRIGRYETMKRMEAERYLTS